MRNKHQNTTRTQLQIAALFMVIAAIIGTVNQCQAQEKATMKRDTIYYLDAKIYPNKKMTLLYGSGSDKSFNFVYFASALMGGAKCPSPLSKKEFIVEKLVDSKGKLWVKGTLLNPEYKIMFDVEGAYDFKEVQ